MGSNRFKANLNLRYNILIMLVYLIAAILIIQLFKLQIVNGEEYRETSNARLTRESTIEAARGNIEDRNGNILATTKTGYSVELYKTKNTDVDLNSMLLDIVNLLEENGDKYINNFPINENFEFQINDSSQIKEWKNKYKIKEDATVAECIEFFKDKYEIIQEDNKEVLKIIILRYEISTQGYSSTKSIKIAENISKISAIQFNEKNADFPGVNITEDPVRVYPNENLASHIIGYIGKIDNEVYKVKQSLGYKMTDYIGKMGIEYVLEHFLKGISGTKQIDMSVDGTVIDDYVVEEAISGDTVILTIDSQIQEKMENIIEESVIDLKNQGKQTDIAAAVLMDVNNGEVLAMCSYPDFSPQSFVGGISNEDWKDIRDGNKLFNNAVQSANAPGSTFKMVTATAALEEGVTNENEVIYDRGVYPYGHNPVCWYYTEYHRGHGNVTIKTAIQKSCNYFFYEMGRRLGVDTMAKYAEFYGLGKKTGIELTGEVSGTVASTQEAEKRGEKWYSSQTLSAAIGQSYNNYTPIQMARYISIIANGGNYISPTVIKEIKDASGNVISKDEVEKHVNELLGIEDKQTSNLQIKDETLNIIKSGMRLVTAYGGTAYSIFKDFPKSVAGKTGSAQAKSGEKGEYANGWFVGFTPYEAPEVAVVVFLEDGTSNSYASIVAKKILEAYYSINDNNNIDLQENIQAQAYTETN